MKRTKELSTGLIMAGALVLASGAAHAATSFTWEYSGSSPFNNSINYSGNGNTGSGGTTASGLTVSYTAWANTNGSDGTSSALYAAQRLHGGTHNLSLYTSNMAACNEASSSSCAYPNHAIDNHDANEFVLFVFSEAVVLNELAIGWPDYDVSLDTDMTVAAYTGAGAMPDMDDLSSDAIDSGDFFVEHLLNVPKDGSGSPSYGATVTFNSGGLSSKYWLVGAYNHHLGGDSHYAGNDYIKLALLGGDIPDAPPPRSTGVPEPMTLGLVGLGLMGLRRARRMNKR